MHLTPSHLHILRARAASAWRRSSSALALLAVLPLVGATAAQASAATLYAGPASTVVAGSCTTAATPCRLDFAVGSAAPGDSVVVESGTYRVTYPVVGSGAITVTGQSGQPRPALIGAATLSTDTLDLSGGATVSGLYIEANGPQDAALSLDGGHADNLILYASSSAAQGEALSAKDSAAGTVVTDTVARSEAPGGEAVSFKDGVSAGTATVINVTAVGSAPGTDAFNGNMATGSASVKNSIAVGGAGAWDVTSRPATTMIAVAYSNLRPGASIRYTDNGNNQSAAPLFCDASAHHFQESSGSPTIAAGQVDPANQGLSDPDGTARVSGSSVDIGAYQYTGRCPSGDSDEIGETGDDGDEGDSPADPLTGPGFPPGAVDSGALSAPGAAGPSGDGIIVPPVLGRSVFVAPEAGSVLIKRPGARAFVALRSAATVPVGSTVDARRGRVRLVSAVSRVPGRRQTGHFFNGQFAIRQSAAAGAHGMTDLIMSGGDFQGCVRPVHSSHLASVSRARARPLSPHHVVRLLWGRDSGGHFETWGRSSIATVRGTYWLTEDRCDGTLTRVLRGRVLVRDARRHRSVLVSAGHGYLVRHR